MKRDWHEEFNALPQHIRTIGSAIEAKLRIQHLTFEKERLRKRYRQSCVEINSHIKNCEEWLRKLDNQ